MKKDNFLKGTLMATFYIVIGKIIGIIYVIPFHKIIGEKGGALYSYAYSTYSIFLNLSTVGIPLAISKIVSEYDSRGFYRTQKKIYIIARNIVIIVASTATLLLFLLAPFIAWSMMGDIPGGNTVGDITFVIRVSAAALLFVAILGTMRGFLQGNRYISVSSSSQVIEQIARVVFVVLGSYFVKNVLKCNLKQTVGIAVFGATVGAFAAIIYLKNKISKDKSSKTDYEVTDEEKRITNSLLMKKLFIITIPFVIVGIIDPFYEFVNSLTVVKTLVNNCGFSACDAENIKSVIGTWGLKFNAIVMAVASGATVSVLPNITKDIVSKNIDGMKKKVNKTLQILIYTTLPMATGLYLLAQPVWNIFYSQNELGVKVFMFNIFVTIFSSLGMNINVIMQSLNKFKIVYISSLSGVILHAIAIIPLMIFFDRIGWGAYNGVTFSVILGLSLSTFINLLSLKKIYKIKYKKTVRELVICVIAVLAMTAIIILLKLFIPTNIPNRGLAILCVAFFSLIGSSIYIFITYSAKTVDHIFGKNILKKIPILNRLSVK
ncbi:MAG: oligosaccharide flippase family protein [Oscillospiraceae bacterium]|nr:oligosaccharide flippase family protein [Oscillospiraceae bacterium]